MKSSVLINFLVKYLFIMKAASDGWRISYVGGGNFEFYNTFYNKNTKDVILNIDEFLEKYIYDFHNIRIRPNFN